MARTLLIFILLQAIPYKRLKWADFRGKAPRDTPFIALTVSNIEFEIDQYDTTYHYTVACEFEPGQSWTKAADSAILCHEQIHLDITRRYSEALQGALQPLQGQNSGKEAERLYDRCIESWKAAEENYDAITSHGKDSQAQEVYVEYMKSGRKFVF